MQNCVIIILEKNVNVTLIANVESQYNNFWRDNLIYLYFFFIQSNLMMYEV